MLPSIPVDVLEAIMERVQCSDLATCCRTSKTIYPYSKQALYRNIHLNPRNVLKACFTLCSNLDLARRVKTFVLFGEEVYMSLGVIQDTLLAMPQLQTLVLLIGRYGSWILPPRETCPFQLSTFRCGFLFGNEVLSFLVGQRKLKQLSLNPRSTLSTSWNAQYKPLPELTAISAPLSMVQRVLPGRPIREVIIYPDAPATDPTMLDCLTHSVAENGVQRLTASLEYLHLVGGERLATLAPNLTHLTLHALGVNAASERTDHLFPGWMKQLLEYQQLHCFTMRFDPKVSTIPCQDIDFSDLVTMVFESSIDLRYFVLTFSGLKASYTCKRMHGYDWTICENSEVA